MTTKSRKQNITALASLLDEQSKTIKLLADSLLELSKEVRINREFIEKNASLSKKTIEALAALSNIDDPVSRDKILKYCDIDIWDINNFKN